MRDAALLVRIKLPPFDLLRSLRAFASGANPWLAMSEAAKALRLALSSEARSGHSIRPLRGRIEWWRRRELNPRPKARRRRTLHACPLLDFRARRVEAAKYHRALASENLAATRRGATWPPACLMAFGPQPPGEVKANVTA